MKLFKFLILITLVLVLLMPHSVLASGNAVVSATAPNHVNFGDTFTVDVTMTPNNAVAGAQFNLSFDPAMVSVDSVVEGNLFSQDGASTYFVGGTIDNTAGTVTNVVSVIISPGETISTFGTFATITLTAKGVEGSAPFTLSNVIVGDINGQAVPTSLVSGETWIDDYFHCMGDANGDGWINISDFGILSASFAKMVGDEGYDARANFNHDSIVNISDFGILAVNFGTGR